MFFQVWWPARNLWLFNVRLFWCLGVKPPVIIMTPAAISVFEPGEAYKGSWSNSLSWQIGHRLFQRFLAVTKVNEFAPSLRYKNKTKFSCVWRCNRFAMQLRSFLTHFETWPIQLCEIFVLLGWGIFWATSGQTWEFAVTERSYNAWKWQTSVHSFSQYVIMCHNVAYFSKLSFIQQLMRVNSLLQAGRIDPISGSPNYRIKL